MPLKKNSVKRLFFYTVYLKVLFAYFEPNKKHTLEARSVSGNFSSTLKLKFLYSEK